jgi:predicted amidohydrolase
VSGESFTLALAQPRPLGGEPAAANVERAVDALGQAAERGAQLICFPEGYPGPLRAGESYDATAALSEAARVHGIAVCWSRVEPAERGRHQMVAYVHGPDGRQLVRYLRSHPATGDVHPLLNGAQIEPGPVLATFPVAGVPCGLLVCSELWLPEIARVLALRGAVVLLAPAGGAFGSVAANWRLIARARAIENELFVGLTQCLYAREQGSALIAGPEADVASSTEEGVLVGRLDLARMRWLRERDDSMVEPKPFRSLPGLLRARRPELYRELGRPRPDLYQYADSHHTADSAPVSRLGARS